MPKREQIDYPIKKYPITVEITAEIREMIYSLCVREMNFVHTTSPARRALNNVVSWIDDMPEPLEDE